MSQVLGLDVGTKTIGVARADTQGRLASPWLTVRRSGLKQDIPKLLALIAEWQATTIVVGLPLALDGTEGRSARLARQVGQALSERCEIVYQDERFSTVEASRQLHEAGMDSRRQRAVIDQAAAVVILQDWLDQSGTTKA